MAELAGGVAEANITFFHIAGLLQHADACREKQVGTWVVHIALQDSIRSLFI